MNEILVNKLLWYFMENLYKDYEMKIVNVNGNLNYNKVKILLFIDKSRRRVSNLEPLGRLEVTSTN